MVIGEQIAECGLGKRENRKIQRSEGEGFHSDNFREVKSIPPRFVRLLVSASEIFAALPKRSREERRHLAAAIFDSEKEADLLRGCDHPADEHFHMMEEKDAGTGSRGNLAY